MQTLFPLAGVLFCGIARAQPANDEPCTALPLEVNEACGYISVDNTDGTLSMDVPLPYCGGLEDADVWYTLTVPASGIVQFHTVSGTLDDAAMSVYKASSCDGPLTLLDCADDQGQSFMPEIHLTALEPGSTLFVRLWGHGGFTGTFDLCAYGPLDLPPGDCVHLLEMTDSYGDGWDGASVGISINGGAFEVHSLDSGTYALHLLGVDLGDALVMNYSAGPFNEENGVRLGLPGFSMPNYAEYGTLSPGILYATTVDCMPPPSTPGDCHYAAPLCGDTSFAYGSMTPGFAVDLDPTNYGCLIAGEQTGIWTQFKAATAGTIGFTLSPQLPSTDIDFAIWGPLDSISCPPDTLPVRCSFAALYGNTGLSTTAWDNSESASGNGWVQALTVETGQRFLLYINDYSQDGSGVDLSWQLSDGASLECLLPPLAQMQVSEPVIPPGASVDLLDLSSNDPSSWYWSMPGGSPSFSMEQNPTGIVYAAPGCYDVSLTATNADGSGSTTQLCAVEVDPNTGIRDAGELTITHSRNGFQVHGAPGELMDADLYDALGRVVVSVRDRSPLSLSTAALMPGHYLLRVHSGQDLLTRILFITR